MPTAEATFAPTLAPPPVRLEVHSSIVMELVWAVCVKPDDTEAEFPVRAARFAAVPDMEERILALWGDGESCFTEAFVVAERGGVLFETDPQRLWAGLAEGAAAPPRFEPLASETPEDQARFRARLARLHDDPGLRRRWLDLLRDVWSAVEGAWRGEGRDVADALAWDLRARVPEVGSYADIAPLVEGCDFGGLLPKLVSDGALAGLPVVLAPAWLGRKGFLVALTTCLLYGPPNTTRPTGPSHETRERARRHKALGDPTRLFIFEAAARRPRTVGELAKELDVAQPTVSNHVRVLRDAGLLDQEKGGGRRLVADVASFERFLDECRRVVTRPPDAVTHLASKSSWCNMSAMAATMVPGRERLPDVLPTERLSAAGRPYPGLRDHLRRIPGRRNALTVVGAWIQSFGVVAAAAVLDRWWGYLLAFFLVGRGFALLNILAHEAAHRLLFARRRLNDFVGRWLLAYPALMPFDVYRRSHMAHHRDELGPDEPDTSLYAGYPISRASMRRKLTRDAVGISGWKNLVPLLRATTGRSSRPVALRIVGVQAAIWASFWVASGKWWLYPVLWLGPWLTVWRVLNRLRAIAEHAGMQRSEDRRQTTHVVRQRLWARFWLVPYNTGWHLAHHVDSGIPWRRLPALHRELVDAGWVTPDLEYRGYLALWRALAAG